jgi:two-component system chemotaxis response regulator CheB
MTKIKVLIVDDSALMRRVLTELISQDPGIEVIGTASDPYVARDKIKALNPDVLTLDVEMPRMDGLVFLEKLMRGHPMPVVMVSSLTENGCETTLRALELGAVDFVTKPKLDVKRGTFDLAQDIINKIKAASRAKINCRLSPTNGAHPPAESLKTGALINSTHKVIAIGASTGGTEAIKEVLVAMPADSPGIVIVQHMPEKFTQSFAERLDSLCQIQVKEAQHGDRILPGHALLAPGNYHMTVTRSGANYTVQVFMGERVNHHRPSVDVLFDSCARALGGNAVGVILTGMGHDGARGMLAMRTAGARTVAQDEATSLVFGMPKEAIAAGAVDEIMPLSHISSAIGRLLVS